MFKFCIIFTFESDELLNEMLNSFFTKVDLLDSSIGIGLSLPIAPITSQVAPTINGLVSSSNITKNNYVNMIINSKLIIKK